MAVRLLFKDHDADVRSAVSAFLRQQPGFERLRDDLVQATWIRLLEDNCRRLRGYRPERGGLGYFVRLVAGAQVKRVLGQLLKGAKASSTRATDDIDSTSSGGLENLEATLLDQDFLDRLRRLVREKLSDDDIHLYEEHYIKGRDPEELAKELGITLDTFYARKSRLKRRIIKMMRRLLGPLLWVAAVLAATHAISSRTSEAPFSRQSSAYASRLSGDL